MYSSHYASLVSKLSCLMSNRGVHCVALPLVRNVQSASINFHYVELNARLVAFYGLIPALIYKATVKDLPSQTRTNLVNECRPTMDAASMTELLRSYITGNYSDVPHYLLALMDVCFEDKIRWIPYNMIYVLEELGEKSSNPWVVKAIVNLFNEFVTSKENSGDAWEALFVITLLIRALTNEFDEVVLASTDFSSPEGWTVSYNLHYDHSVQPFMSFSDCRNATDLIKRMEVPPSVLHIAVYYPPHAQFEMYDVIVAVYDNGHRTLLGYQCKQGKGAPGKPPCEEITSFVVQGDASATAFQRDGWTYLSDAQLDVFFGVSGRDYTPSKWKKLNETVEDAAEACGEEM